MAPKSYKPKGKNSETRSFAGIPRIVMENADYIHLANRAKALLFELAYQFRGKNNGDLTAAWGIMRKRGFKSKGTLSRATKELLEKNMIIRTREGIFLNPGGKCALYALSWQAIDECFGKRLEVAPTITPPRKFSLERKQLKHPVQ